MIEMRSTRSTRKITRKQRGGAATPLPLSFFNPGSAPFSASSSALSTAATSTLARAGIYQTGGGKSLKQKSLKQKSLKQKSLKQKSLKKQRGGFSPSVMGPFLKNVEALAAPLSIYLGWKMIKGLRGSKKSRK
jgi:hypothetical protein